MTIHKRIGLLGGAFDPPHNGHLHLANSAQLELNLDALHWMPTAYPSHRQPAVASFEQRCQMVSLMIDGHTGWTVDRREENLPDPSYFYQTLCDLQGEQPDADLFVLIGADQWASFPRWHRYADIMAMAALVVMPREGFATPSAREATPIDSGQVIFLASDPLTVSSSDYRQGIRSDNVSDALALYINNQHN